MRGRLARSNTRQHNEPLIYNKNRPFLPTFCLLFFFCLCTVPIPPFLEPDFLPLVLPTNTSKGTYDTCSRLGSLVGVPEDEDDRVAPQEELGDVALLVLLRAYTWRDRCVSAGVYTHTHTDTHSPILPSPQPVGRSVSQSVSQPHPPSTYRLGLLALARLGHLRPHLLHIFQQPE